MINHAVFKNFPNIKINENSYYLDFILKKKWHKFFLKQGIHSSLNVTSRKLFINDKILHREIFYSAFIQFLFSFYRLIYKRRIINLKISKVYFEVF